MISKNEVLITGAYHVFDYDVKNILKKNGGNYNNGDDQAVVQLHRGWIINTEKMDLLFKDFDTTRPDITIKKIPNWVFKTIS